MKKLLLIFLAALLCNSCSNDDYGSDAALPPATTTGAGTFACRVNGKSFIDPGSTFNCYYQYNNGGYYFGIGGEDEDYERTNMPWAVNLISENLSFEEGQTYQLLHEADGNIVGNAVFSFSPTENYSQETNSQFTGELTLTKFETTGITRIISGTFWFDIPHPITGEAIHITDGRFDTTYLY